MDRLKFNNLVISNKKVIQKARAQTIAKIVQKLRKTKEALAKNPDSEKEKIRLRKNTECLAQLKALKYMDMVRQSLLQEGTNPNAVIANERSTPDELGIAMLRLNKLMHGLVDKFVETLKLSTTDKEAKWREEILETSKRRAKIERTEERKRKRKELKEQKAQTKNRLEWLEQNKVVDADVNGATAETPTLQVSKVNDQEIPQSFAKTENSPVLKVKKEKTPKTPAKKERNLQKKQAFDEQINPEITKLSSKKQNLNTIKENNAEPQLEGRPKESKPKPFEKKPAREQKPKPRLERQPSIDEEEPQLDNNRPTHVVDPFFITESGQPYLSSAVVLSGDNDSEADEEQAPPPVKRFRNEDRRSNTYREKPERQPEFKARKPTDDRHPSWLAKQQQKPIIGDFRGKKITFGDDGQAAEIIAPSINQLTATAAPLPTDGMHPSWVAKQKFKPKIAAFQGTKIKFDED
uniref:Rlb1 n=2 Tax=Drosophila melanogaster TaxID=7227 RepID=Q27411_DROME|nr:Rlb1 [Drosophila melanogaster]AOQ14340.1 Rlb1-PA [synthetic construct]AAF54389.1 Rlb1 [Drosophila melanogaster]AAM51060.1 SD13613p [Drosophila melanogaster]CAA51684.1 Rlb1 [Drosophila melanogaster]CAA51688.1 Rlb1 [Drosophila melanogaster]|eukprot:NP_477099.1 Rlb1 [Drosophila melanogaster]